MNDFLPEEFRFSHDFCLYLHDCMIQFIVEGEPGGFFSTRFDIKSENEAEQLKKNPDLFILDWLENKGYSEVLGEVLLKAIFPALLSDFCHFVYEALSCSRKAKLTVAYALLRKPFRESLHYMEWILADPEGLLNTFYYQPSKELAFNKIGNPDIAKSVIRKATKRTLHYEIYDPDFLYDLRFNKDAHFGFDGLWNKAIHLITTKRSLATEQANFNFIFSGDEERWTQWQHIYLLLPYLLFYALDVCEVLMALMAKEPPSDLAEVTFHRSLGFILWAYDARRFVEGYDRMPTGFEMVVLDCPKCKQRIGPTEELIHRLFAERKLKCPKCRRRIKLPQFVQAA